MKVIEGNQYIFQYEIKGTIAKINYLGVQKRYRNKGIGKKVVVNIIMFTTLAMGLKISNKGSPNIINPPPNAHIDINVNIII